ncbi:MAG: serine protease [Proteobacteria bacterium]|nr:serine protease [Pseudomonadota bacterium]
MSHHTTQQHRSLAIALAAGLAGFWCIPFAASAQPLTYGAVDKATVRVFVVKRSVDTQRVPSQDGSERTVAVPVVSHGSGVLVNRHGLVLTAYHVIEGASIISVQQPEMSHALPARVVHASPEHDFAFLLAPGRFEHHAALPTRTRSMRVREPVHALGYPIDAALEHPLSSPGIVAGALSNGNMQLGMSLNPGNSGGPLIDRNENLVGIVIARGDPSQGVLGLGVALPIAHAVSALRSGKLACVELGSKKEAGFRPHDGCQQRHALAGGSRPRFSAHQRRLAQFAATLAAAGPIGFIGDVAQTLQQSEPAVLPAALEAVAAAEGNPDLLALSAGYLWDAVMVMLEDAGSDHAVAKLPKRSRKTASAYLHKAIRLCHEAVRRDPTVYGRSQFVEHVLDHWPDVPSPHAVKLHEVAGTSPRGIAHGRAVSLAFGGGSK